MRHPSLAQPLVVPAAGHPKDMAHLFKAEFSGMVTHELVDFSVLVEKIAKAFLAQSVIQGGEGKEVK